MTTTYPTLPGLVAATRTRDRAVARSRRKSCQGGGTRGSCIPVQMDPKHTGGVWIVEARVLVMELSMDFTAFKNRKVCASLQLSIVNSAARIAGRLRLKRGPGRTKHFS